MTINKTIAVSLTFFSFSLCLLAQETTSTDFDFQRRIVMEEYTGTWCGNCPRGTAGMKRLKEYYGDRIIPIAIHCGSGEPMQIMTYPDLQPGSGIPACELNRRGKLDPYAGSGGRGYNHFGIDLDVEGMLSEPVEAAVSLTAEWADAQQWDVRYDVTTVFTSSKDNGNFALALILLEDGLEGVGRAWEQVNYYSAEYSNSLCNDFSDDDMKEWVDAPVYVQDVTYNHVPVNTYGIKKGIDGSIQYPIVAMQPQHFSDIVTTLNQKVIQDKNNLYAVVLLLNNDTGEIINADRAEIMPYGSNLGITQKPAETSPSHIIYNIKGQRVDRVSNHGIYIVNGRKVIK